MNTSNTKPQSAGIISADQVLAHWQGHRGLTRRVIEAFPEKEFFAYSLGGMRTCAALVKELLAIAEPGLKQIVEGGTDRLDEDFENAKTKADFLALWDKSTEAINQYWAQIADERFSEKIMTFGQYEGTVLSSIQYFVDNEIHHRGQAYVYLRTLGIEPPFFWER